MKTIIAVLLLTIQPLLAIQAFRYEFNPLGRAIGDEGTGVIEFLRPTGTDVPIVEAIYDLQFRGFDSLTNGFYPDLVNIVAPVWSSLGELGYFGTMTWDAFGLSGFWGFETPFLEAPLHDPPLLGGTKYRFTSATLESYWPLEYFFNESVLSGGWTFAGEHQVPDTGGTLVMLGIGILGLLAWRRREIVSDTPITPVP